jgi:hypothetical protein
VANAIRRAATDRELKERCHVANPRLIAARASAPLNGSRMAEHLERLADGHARVPGILAARERT